MRRLYRLNAAGALSLIALLWATGPDSPVADAAMQGDVESVRALLRSGADVNAAQGDGMTALHWGAERGDAELADLLIYAGANVHAVTRIGDYAPLHLASGGAHLGVVRSLLDAGADPTAVTSTGGATALHFAAQGGGVDVVRMLLAHGASVNARESGMSQTPLMFAAAAGRAAAVAELAAAGADLGATGEVRDAGLISAADRVAGKRRDEGLQAFRAQDGGDETWRQSATQIQAAIKAAREVQAAILESGGLPSEEGGAGVSFEDYGASAVGGWGGLTALLHAVREGHPGAALALLDAGADVNQWSAGDHTSPLLMAMLNGHYDLGLDILERGADPNVRSVHGNQPLFAALNTQWAPKARYPQQQAYRQQRVTYLEVMDELLKAGADVDARLKRGLWYMEYNFSHLGVDMTGATPFWRAAHALDVDAMKLLSSYGANPDLGTVVSEEGNRRGDFARRRGPQEDLSGLPPSQPGDDYVTPILAAAGHGYPFSYTGNSHRHVPDAWLPAVKYLVEEHGAEVNARDASGYSPLHNAAARGDNEMILYLVERGADVMVVTRQGLTTVDAANGPQQRVQPFPETIELLEGMGASNNHNCRSC